MSLVAGTRLGPYEIESAIGAGGMGEVYKARDTRLDRTVAIKVLPVEISGDPERRARFEREAKTVAGLNHPNICVLYDVGDHDGAMFLVMEHIVGQTLAERLGKGPLPLEQALNIATEIAEALSAAHRQGVIHRDLKPANVMLTKTGAKLLDFGLAKLTGHGEQPAASMVTAAPTRAPLTGRGVIVGTLQYMAPEQVEGKTTDARTDIWALGAILYEMLTGKRAFAGNTAASLVAAILAREPDPVASLQPLTPPGVERLVRRCLAKQPEDRWESAHDVADELRWMRETSGVSAAMGAQRTPYRIPRWGRWVALCAGGIAIAAALAAWLMQRPAPTEPTANVLTSYTGVETQPSFSPDGGKIAFVWDGDKEGNRDIYVKQIGSPGPPMRLTTNAAAETQPAWSPDDRWIGFVRPQPGQKNVAVLLISPLGGPERTLAEMIDVEGLCWTPDAKWLVFSERDAEEHTTISAIEVETAERRRLTTFQTKGLATQGQAMGDSRPAVSPDGRMLAFFRGGNFVYDVHVLALTPDLRPAGEPSQITGNHYASVGGFAWTANSREVVYAAGGVRTKSLWRMSVSGRQRPERLPIATPDASFPAVAHKTSRLVYAWLMLNVNLWRLDLQTGERRMHIGSTYESRIPSYSPDGSRIAFQSNRNGNWEVWTCDAADGSNCLPLTSFGGPQCGSPKWSPDGRRVALDSRVEGWSEIYVIAADGGTPRRVTNTPGFNNVRPRWSADGRWLYFDSDRSGDWEIWKMPADGGQAAQVTRAGGAGAHSSPDGRYIYYSKASGIFRMPSEGGQEEQMLAGIGGLIGVTAKGVYFIAAGTLKIRDAATGDVRTLATGVVARGGACISPDDRYVVWAPVDPATTDLMLVENFR